MLLTVVCVCACSCVCLHEPTVLYISDDHSASMLPQCLVFFIIQSLFFFFLLKLANNTDSFFCFLKARFLLCMCAREGEPRACVAQVLFTPSA